LRENIKSKVITFSPASSSAKKKLLRGAKFYRETIKGLFSNIQEGYSHSHFIAGFILKLQGTTVKTGSKCTKIYAAREISGIQDSRRSDSFVSIKNCEFCNPKNRRATTNSNDKKPKKRKCKAKKGQVPQYQTLSVKARPTDS